MKYPYRRIPQRTNALTMLIAFAADGGKRRETIRRSHAQRPHTTPAHAQAGKVNALDVYRVTRLRCIEQPQQGIQMIFPVRPIQRALWRNDDKRKLWLILNVTRQPLSFHEIGISAALSPAMQEQDQRPARSVMRIACREMEKIRQLPILSCKTPRVLDQDQ